MSAPKTEMERRILARDVEIWRRWLAEPLAMSVDAGLQDDLYRDGFASVLMDFMAEKLRPDVLEGALHRFAQGLYAASVAHERGSFGLSTDYHASPMLRAALDYAGLMPRSTCPPLPSKSRTHRWESYYLESFPSVQASRGYHGQLVYHYPLPDDMWALTSLFGSKDDVARLVETDLVEREYWPVPDWVPALEG